MLHAAQRRGVATAGPAGPALRRFAHPLRCPASAELARRCCQPKGQRFMGRLGLSFVAFWRVLREPEFADQVRRLVDAGPSASPSGRTADRAAPTLTTPPTP